MNVIPFPMPRLHNAMPRPVAGFGQIPIWDSDLDIFAGEITATPRGLVAIHRDAEGRQTGREWTIGGAKIRHVAETGSRKSLVASPANETTRRIAIAAGPLSLVALAALECRRDTTYCSPGGTWTAAAGAAAERLIREWRPEEVAVAIAPDLAARCLADLTTRLRDIDVHLEMLTPPTGGWVETLRRTRAGRPIAR